MVDSSRHLDQFGDLTLGDSDDEDTKNAPQLSPAAVGPYALLLGQQDVQQISMDDQAVDADPIPKSMKDGTKKHRKKKKNKNKPNKWADKCMYAELLEMAADAPWSESPGDAEVNDGLPNDLESKWVAVGPVPVGKRCLAVTHQSSGISGVGTLLII